MKATIWFIPAVSHTTRGKSFEALGAAKDQGGRLESITVEICDNKKMLDLHVPGNYYRGEKLKLYSDGINLELGKGQILGEMVLRRNSIPRSR